MHFVPSPEVMHFFSEEVAKLSAFQDELRKSASIADKTVGEVTKGVSGKLLKHLPGMALGAGALYGGHRLYKDIQVGEAMRQQGGF